MVECEPPAETPDHPMLGSNRTHLVAPDGGNSQDVGTETERRSYLAGSLMWLPSSQTPATLCNEDLALVAPHAAIKCPTIIVAGHRNSLPISEDRSMCTSKSRLRSLMHPSRHGAIPRYSQSLLTTTLQKVNPRNRRVFPIVRGPSIPDSAPL